MNSWTVFSWVLTGLFSCCSNSDLLPVLNWGGISRCVVRPLSPQDGGQTYVLQQLLQVLLQLVEVARRDEALAALLQAVSGQLYQLMVDEAEDPIGQRAHLVRRRGGEQLGQTLLHLSRGLRGGGRRRRKKVSHWGDKCDQRVKKRQLNREQSGVGVNQIFTNDSLGKVCLLHPNYLMSIYKVKSCRFTTASCERR